MTKYIEKNINIKELPKDFPIDICLLENNEKQIGQICNFYMGENNLLLVNGFKGSGKSKIVGFTMSYVNPDVICLPYMCVETTTLDDMLLSFFDIFRAYTIMGKIIPPKIKVDNFEQKINSYFNTITNPILIVIDSFDAIVKENKLKILNFISHLLKFQNIKIIIISKSFSSDDFDGIPYDKVTILAFAQKIFEKYLREHDIKQIGVLSNELYKISKGYYNNLVLTANIISLRQLSLVKFLELYSKSYMAFSEFIIREALSFVDPVSAHLFRLLTVMRIPIHVNLLKSLKLYDENRIMFFIQNSILSASGEYIYLKDIFREVLENQIPENVMVKLHSACIDLYNTQLPLKPLERDLRLSRQTMRNEIEYHSMFIPKKPQLDNIKIIQPMLVEPIIEPEKVSIEQKLEEPTVPVENKKEEKLEQISFIIEDESILDNIADSINDFVVTTSQNSKLEQESVKMSLTQILNAAKKEEQTYNYKRAIMLYQSALTKTDDDDFYTFLPSIYVKLAKDYQKVSDWYEALEYYTQAQDFYFNAGNNSKVCEIKFEIANIYYLLYKYDNAKYILSELEKFDDLPKDLAIKVCLTSAKLYNDVDTQFNYYNKALKMVEMSTDKSILSELYYKMGVVNDEKNNPRAAAEFYKKCIGIENNPKINKYLSMAYSNLAELYDEAGAVQLAIKAFNESIKIDTFMKNYNGLYTSSIRLADIYASSDEKKTLEYYNKALEYAKNLKEPFYIAGTYLEFGDFYYLRKDMEKAYKYFILTYNVAKQSFSKDNLDKISSRINDIKCRVSEEEFGKLQEKYGK
jgi:tetratricopeptide (TPR) repeat protein